MSDVDLVNVRPGDLLDSPEYFLATFEPWIWSVIADKDRVARDVGNALAAGAIPYVAPMNADELLPGQSTFVYSLFIAPAGAGLTVAQLARDLNGVKLESSLRRLERVSEGDANDASLRRQVAQTEQQKADDESISATVERILSRLGWVLLIVVVLAVAFGAWRVYRAVRA